MDILRVNNHLARVMKSLSQTLFDKKYREIKSHIFYLPFKEIVNYQFFVWLK